MTIIKYLGTIQTMVIAQQNIANTLLQYFFLKKAVFKQFFKQQKYCTIAIFFQMACAIVFAIVLQFFGSIFFSIFLIFAHVCIITFYIMQVCKYARHHVFTKNPIFKFGPNLGKILSLFLLQLVRLLQYFFSKSIA